MVGQLCQMRLTRRGRGIEGFERSRNRAMPQPALACQQLAVNNLPGQGMAESKMVG